MTTLPSTLDDVDDEDPRKRSPVADDALLTRGPAAAALTRAGYPVTAATLATKATRGGGPPYRVFGRRPVYRLSDLMAWAESQVREPTEKVR
jgi:hypothetical protein